jgi:hypothetical protein
VSIRENMFGNLFGRKDGSKGSAPFYRPYRSDAANEIYNLLFCDNLALFRNGEDGGGDLRAVLSDSTDRESLERIGNNIDAESRVRVLAFNRLRMMKISVPSKCLLGTIIEAPQPDGLDTLAVFPDGHLRYINQSEKMVVFEASPPMLAGKAEEVLRASQFVVNRYGPWDKPRRPPPTGKLVRMSFLVSDGLYFGEGQYDDLMRDRFAAPVIRAASEFLPMLVEEALKIDRGTR